MNMHNVLKILSLYKKNGNYNRRQREFLLDVNHSELSSTFGVHPNQICRWKRQLLDSLPDIFTDRGKKKDKDFEELISELYRQIGQLKVELDWLKKKFQKLQS